MKTYIIHVSDAYEREKHILEQIKNHNFDIEFILEGDKKDLSSEISESYFNDFMRMHPNAMSCSYKHYLAYKNMVKNNINLALIFEDDIFLENNFDDIFSKITLEIKQEQLSNFLISLEDSNLKYINKSKRISGKYLYKKINGRMAGAYCIDIVCAQNMINYIEKNKFTVPIDWIHNKCSEENVISLFWSQPSICIQGSLNGKLKSLIDNKSVGLARILSFRFRRIVLRFLSDFI